MKVLLAIDGSRSAGRARDLAASIRWPSGTRIEVLHVDQLLEGDLNLPPDRYTALHERGQRFIDKQVETAARALRGPNRTVKAKTILGRPASVIVEEAARIGADLLIVGSHGRGPFASALLGSVAAEVVDHASCPVLVARGTALTRAVLAEDGSPGARTAERLLIKWPFLKKLPVRVVTVMNLLPLYNFSGTGYGGTEVIDADVMQKLLDDTRHLNERTAAQGAKRLTTAGLAAKAEVREGEPFPASDRRRSLDEGKPHRARIPREHRSRTPGAGQRRAQRASPGEVLGAHYAHQGKVASEYRPACFGGRRP